MNIQELCAIHGVANVRVTLSAQPLRGMFGLLSYTSSNDEWKQVEVEISEEHYKVADGYKIGFKPVEVSFSCAAARSFVLVEKEKS